MDELHRLTIYQDDDATQLVQYTSDPDGTNPYLKVPTLIAESEVDLLRGTGAIGQESLEVVDVPETPGDQSTGHFTARLANAAGESALNGRRAVHEINRGSGWVTVLDGVIHRIELVRLPTYRVELRDIRERERKRPLFSNTTTPTVLPRGVLDGYGVPYEGAPQAAWLVPPTQPVLGRWESTGSRRGVFHFDPDWDDLPPEIVLGEAQESVLRDISRATEPLPSGVADRSLLKYNRISILWRAQGGGAYTEVERPLGDGIDAVLSPSGVRTFLYVRASGFVRNRNGDKAEVSYLRELSMAVEEGDEGLLPSDDQLVEVIVRYRGPLSEEWPLHIEGITDGEFLQNCYDGEYSSEDPRVRYDESAILAFERPFRARITERVEDMREWLQDNWYAPRGAAPAIVGGLVKPIVYAIPPTDEELPQLDGTNCTPMPGWSHGVEDAINAVSVVYYRDQALPMIDDPTGKVGGGDRIVEREVRVERYDTDSVDLIGEKRLELETILYRAVGGAEGEPVSGDVLDETGHQLAMERASQALDRFLYGGQRIRCRADRSDSDVEGLVVGDWVLAAASWWPDYQSGERGANRLAQVVARQDQDPAWTSLSLEDAGPDLQPVGQPTLGTLSVSDEGEVIVPVSSVPSGAEARVDYILSDASPQQSDAGWTFAGRTSSTGNVYTPPQPSGATVWVRARGEASGRRPSAWTTPDSITLANRPRVRDLRITFDENGIPTVHGTPNPLANGVRINYAVHFDPDDIPTLDDSEDFAASSGEWELSTVVPYLHAITVEVEPYTGFSGGSVTGTGNEGFRVTVVRPPPENVPWGSVDAVYLPSFGELQARVQGNFLSASFEWALYRQEDPPTSPEPDDAEIEESGTIDERSSLILLEELAELEDPDRFWFVVWFYPASEQGGEAGPAIIVEAEESEEGLVPRVPFFNVVTETGGPPTSTFQVELRDPDDLVDRIEYRLQTVGGNDTGWVVQDITPVDEETYQRSRNHSEGELVIISFRARWRPPGADAADDEWVVINSKTFGDPGSDTPTIDLSLRLEGSSVIAVINGHPDVASVKVLGALTNYPSDAAVRGSGAQNGLPAEVTLALELDPHQIGAVKAFGYTETNGGGDETPAAVAKIYRGIARRPQVQVAATRSGVNVTVTLEIEDLSLSVLAAFDIQYRVRASDDVSWGAWTDFPSGSGTIGVNQYLSRNVTVSAPDGKDTQFEWRVPYLNEVEDGTFLGDVINLSNLRQIEKTLRFGWSGVLPAFDGTQFSTNSDSLTTSAAGASAAVFNGTVVFPVGIILTEMKVRGYRADAGCDVEVALSRISDTGGNTVLREVIHNTVGWQTRPGSLNETVGALLYVLNIGLDRDGGAENDARYLWTDFDYLAPGYSETY